MAKQTKDQYVKEFFKKNPKVKTLWANPESEFFTDINYANNSLKKDDEGEIGKLEVFVNEATTDVVKEVAVVPVNPIVPEVVNTLKVSETESLANKVSSEIVINKSTADLDTSKANVGKKATVKKAAKDIGPGDVKKADDLLNPKID